MITKTQVAFLFTLKHRDYGCGACPRNNDICPFYNIKNEYDSGCKIHCIVHDNSTPDFNKPYKTVRKKMSEELLHQYKVQVISEILHED